MQNSVAIIPHIIDQHAEEAAFLWLLRDNAVTEAHYNLEHLGDLEQRIEAHIDGLRVAAEAGWQCCLQNLQQFSEAGEMFVAATLAFESIDTQRLHTLYALAEQHTETERGLISALGWVNPQYLKGKVSGMLVSAQPFWQRIGIAACAIHRVDPGKHLETALKTQDTALCCRALKAAGELGRTNLQDLITYRLQSSETAIRFWAAWALTLLGNRTAAPQVLQSFLPQADIYAFKAAQLLFRISTPEDTQYLLSTLIKQHQQVRLAIQACGMCGDPYYMPWLIQQMETPEYARVAGEAFSLLTGVDLAYDDLEMDQPEGFHAGATESPQDENLPWPDANLIQQWWQQHQGKYTTKQRYLMGAPVTVQHCQSVLQTAMQRQRYAAALELALLNAQAVLVETRAKAERQ